MKIAVYGRPDFTVLNAFADGCEVLGHKVVWRRDTVFTEDQTEPFDVVAVVGLHRKNREIQRAYAAKGVPVIVMDLGHFRRDLRYRQLGINRLAWVPPVQLPDDRWKALGLDVVPREGVKGDYILFVGQVPDDASHGMKPEEYYQWVAGRVEELRAASKLPLKFRPHPEYYVGAQAELGDLFDEVSPREYPLEQDLAGSRAVVTYCSTVGMEALALGIPVVADESAPYSEFSRVDVAGIDELAPPPPLEVQQFLNRMAYGQWTEDELASGAGPEFVLKCLGEEREEKPAETNKPKGGSHGGNVGAGKRQRVSKLKQLHKQRRG